MALATVEQVGFSYPGAAPALEEVSLSLEPGELVAVLGPSGGGKSTLLRALAGLVPHFHGGRFTGRVVVDGRDTRRARPAELAGTVATLFQDPEDQVVMTRVANEVAFGLENLGVAPERIWECAEEALEAVEAVHLATRRTSELSGGELQRVCLASTLALEPLLLLLDEPTSQLDPHAAEELVRLAVRLAREQGTAVVLSEQRPALALESCDRVLFVDRARIVVDAARDEAISWLAEHRPAWVEPPAPPEATSTADLLCSLAGIGFEYQDGVPVLDDVSLELRRGEIVALVGPNGSGKTTLAKLAAGLLEPSSGTVDHHGRAAYLSQDPGRYLVKETALDEVALAANRDDARRALAAVGLAGFEDRHPRDLSSGERERLALASVLAVRPDVLVLDEPTRGVDPARKRELARLLRAGAEGRATLVVTHDVAFATAVADRQVSLAAAREPVHA